MELKFSKLTYLGKAWGVARDYARSSYPLSYIYGRVRGAAQPWISTKFNAQHVQDGVYIGDLASASNAAELKNIGITHIVTVVLGVAPQFPKDFHYLNIPIMDVESEDITPYLPQAIGFIESALAAGGKVLVHCMCGVSRSATIIAAWIMSRKTQTVDETIQLIKDQRGCINPNPSFRSQLEGYNFAKPSTDLPLGPLTSQEEPLPKVRVAPVGGDIYAPQTLTLEPLSL